MFILLSSNLVPILYIWFHFCHVDSNMPWTNCIHNKRQFTIMIIVPLLLNTSLFLYTSTHSLRALIVLKLPFVFDIFHPLLLTLYHRGHFWRKKMGRKLLKMHLVFSLQKLCFQDKLYCPKGGSYLIGHKQQWNFSGLIRNLFSWTWPIQYNHCPDSLCPDDIPIKQFGLVREAGRGRHNKDVWIHTTVKFGQHWANSKLLIQMQIFSTDVSH